MPNRLPPVSNGRSPTFNELPSISKGLSSTSNGQSPASNRQSFTFNGLSSRSPTRAGEGSAFALFFRCPVWRSRIQRVVEAGRECPCVVRARGAFDVSELCHSDRSGRTPFPPHRPGGASGHAEKNLSCVAVPSLGTYNPNGVTVNSNPTRRHQTTRSVVIEAVRGCPMRRTSAWGFSARFSPAVV
jgi:hypothetical protein